MLRSPEQSSAISMSYVVAIQLVLEENKKTVTDADQSVSILLLVQAFTNLDHDLFRKTGKCQDGR